VIELQLKDAETDRLLGRLWQEAGEIRAEDGGGAFLQEANDLGWANFLIQRSQWFNGYVYAVTRKRKEERNDSRTGPGARPAEDDDT
jgi:hypothetical protein